MEAELGERVAADRAHPAMRVVDAGAIEDVQQAREHRAADVPVGPGHGAARDVPLEPRAHDELIARADALEERGERCQVVRAVGIGHDDDVAAGRRETAQVRRPVAATPLVDQTRARRGRRFRGAVGRAVVHDEDLALDPGAAERFLRLGHDARHGRDLVETGEHDRDALAHPR